MAGEGKTECSRTKTKIEMPIRITTDVPMRRIRYAVISRPPPGSARPTVGQAGLPAMFQWRKEPEAGAADAADTRGIQPACRAGRVRRRRRSGHAGRVAARGRRLGRGRYPRTRPPGRLGAGSGARPPGEREPAPAAYAR